MSAERERNGGLEESYIGEIREKKRRIKEEPTSEEDRPVELVLGETSRQRGVIERVYDLNDAVFEEREGTFTPVIRPGATPVATFIAKSQKIRSEYGSKISDTGKNP